MFFGKKNILGLIIESTFVCASLKVIFSFFFFMWWCVKKVMHISIYRSVIASPTFLSLQRKRQSWIWCLWREWDGGFFCLNILHHSLKMCLFLPPFSFSFQFQEGFLNQQQLQSHTLHVIKLDNSAITNYLFKPYVAWQEPAASSAHNKKGESTIWPSQEWHTESLIYKKYFPLQNVAFCLLFNLFT